MLLINPKSVAQCIMMVFCAILYTSCDEKEERVVLSNEKKIESFQVKNYTVVIDESAKTISVEVPENIDVSQFSPTILLSTKASVSPASDTPQDFSKPVTYTVTAEDQTAQRYTVTVKVMHGLKDFTLTISGVRFPGTIDYEKKEINVLLNFYSVRVYIMFGGKVLTDAHVLSGYTLTPGSGALVDISNPVDQLLYDNSTNSSTTYKLIIKNTDNALYNMEIFTTGVEIRRLAFKDAYPEDLTGLPSMSFVYMVLSTDDISNLIPGNVNMAENASISPLLTVPQNFNQDVVYTITSQTGKPQAHTIRFVKKSFLDMYDSGPIAYHGIAAGTNAPFTKYRSISPVVEVKLLTDTSVPIACSFDIWPSNDGKTNTLSINPAITLAPGKYTLSVKLANGEQIITRTRFMKS